MSNLQVNLAAYAVEMDVYERRRQALLHLIATRYGGNQAAFASDAKTARSYLNSLLKAEGEDGRKRLGEDKARAMEADLGLMQDALVDPPMNPRRGVEEGASREILELVPDRRHAYPGRRELVGAVALRVMDVEASMGHGMSQPDHENVIMNMVINESWLRRHANFSSPDNLALVTGIGDSMRPTFEDGDSLLVDRGVGDLKVDAIYVLALNDELFIKRIQRRPDGTFMMISDNKAYEPYHIKDAEREQFKVLGRVVMAWNSRRI